MLDGGDIGGYGGSGGFGGSSDAGGTGYGYDAYGNPTGTNTTNNAQQVAYEIMQAIYATQGKRFGQSGRLDQYGNPAPIHGQTGTNMGYNLIDADFTPNITPATVDLIDQRTVDPMGGAFLNSEQNMTPQNSDAGVSDGGGERPWWLNNMGGGMRPNPTDIDGAYYGHTGPSPNQPPTNAIIDYPAGYRPRPKRAYENAYNQWESDL